MPPEDRRIGESNISDLGLVVHIVSSRRSHFRHKHSVEDLENLLPEVIVDSIAADPNRHSKVILYGATTNV